MIKLRPHHLLCIPRFYRGGYNKKFGENLKRICLQIRKNPLTKIKIVKGCDDVCAKCPYKKDRICRKTPKINYYITIQEKKILKKLEIKENQTFKAKDIFNLSISKIKNKELRQICRGCEFLKYCLKYSLNKSFVNNLK